MSALYLQLAQRIFDLWDNRREEDALRSLDRAIKTSSTDGEAAREALFHALLAHRTNRSPGAMMHWLALVLSRFALQETELPEAYRAAVSTYVSVHLDRYESFVESGTIDNVQPQVQPEKFNPDWGVLDWRHFPDESLRARLTVVNLFSSDGVAMLNEQLDGFDAKRTEQAIEDGLASVASWRTINPARLPQDARLDKIIVRALDRLIADNAVLDNQPADMQQQAAEAPDSFNVFVRLVALTWLADRARYDTAKTLVRPEIFWPAIAAACRLRPDCEFLHDIHKELGRTPAARLTHGHCDPRTAYNFLRDVKFEV